MDRDRAAAGHRVAGIDHEIDDDPLELRGIRLNRCKVRAELRLEDDAAKQATQHLLGARHHAVDVEDPRLHDLLAAEGSQLGGQLCRQLGHTHDPLDLASHAVGLVGVAEEEVAVEADRSELVVEVVRDPTGQAPHRIQLLGLDELLEMAALGDVAQNSQVEARPHVRRRGEVDLTDGAVGPQQPIVARERASFAKRRPELVEPNDVLGLGEVVQPLAGQALPRHAEQGTGGRIPVDEAALVV